MNNELTEFELLIKNDLSSFKRNVFYFINRAEYLDDLDDLYPYVHFVDFFFITIKYKINKFENIMRQVEYIENKYIKEDEIDKYELNIVKMGNTTFSDYLVFNFDDTGDIEFVEINIQIPEDRIINVQNNIVKKEEAQLKEILNINNVKKRNRL